MSKKGRSDSKLDQLEPHVRQELIDKFLVENVSLDVARKWLDKEQDVSISLSGLHAWFHRVVWPLRLEMRKQRATQANALISEAQGKEVDWTSAVAEEIGQQAYEMLTMGVNKKMALSFARTALGVEEAKNKLKLDQEKLAQAQEKLAQDERKLTLLEEKARKADEVEALLKERQNAGGGLTEETLEQIEKALGMK